MSDARAIPRPALTALEQFPIVFHDGVDVAEATGMAWAPGRVNLIGEHTDYNDGFVLPIAVDRVAAFAGRGQGHSMVRLWSSHYKEYAQFSLEGLPATFARQREELAGWARYVLGVVTELLRAGVTLSGFDAVIAGDVPPGGGMSSSAALEVATAQACSLFSSGNFTIGNESATFTPMQVAAACQRAEQIASGVRCGILDQAASCLGRPGRAVLLDCRSLEYRYLPFDAPDLSLVVIDTGVRRELASSEYNERRKECEDAVVMLREIITQYEAGRSITALRDITQEEIDRYGMQLPEPMRRRARYVIAENARVLQTVKLLETGAFAEIGKLLWLSHAGLRDEYEVSCDELDILVEIAQQIEGVLGARMLGGGFGGCTINLVKNEAVESLRQAVEREYPRRSGRRASFDVCCAAGGPGYAWLR
jgi:galactokinase